MQNHTITEALEEIEADGRKWDGKAGRELLAELRDKLAPIARRHNRPIDEAVSFAWMELRDEKLLAADSIFAALLHRVELALANAGRAQRLLISEVNFEKGVAAKNSGFAVFGLPERFDELHIVEAEADKDEEEIALRLVSTRTAAALLAESSGMSLSSAAAVVEVLLDSAIPTGKATSSTPNALRNAIKSVEMGARLGCDANSWRVLCGLLFGSQKPTATSAGLIAAEVHGVTDTRAIATARRKLGLAAA